MGKRMAEKKEKAAVWAVATCHSEGDGIDVERVYGTSEDVKRYLVKTANELGEYCDEDTLPKSIDDITERRDGNLYVGPWGSDFHIDYEAYREKAPQDIRAGNMKPEGDEYVRNMLCVCEQMAAEALEKREAAARHYVEDSNPQALIDEEMRYDAAYKLWSKDIPELIKERVLKK